MEILLMDRRARADEPSFNTSLGKTAGMDLIRDGSSHMLSFKTDLAYELNIKLDKVELGQLRNQLIEAAEKQAAKKHK